MRDQRDLALAERRQVMIEPLQRETVKVSEISRDMELRNLTISVGQVFAPCQPAVEQHDARVDLGAMSDEDFVGGNPSRVCDETANNLLFFRTDRGALPNLFKMHTDHAALPRKSPATSFARMGVTRALRLKKAFIFHCLIGLTSCNLGE